jgi:hypothetical protein
MSRRPKIIVNLTQESVAGERTEIADRPLRRMRGLLGRQSLAAGEVSRRGIDVGDQFAALPDAEPRPRIERRSADE